MHKEVKERWKNLQKANCRLDILIMCRNNFDFISPIYTLKITENKKMPSAKVWNQGENLKKEKKKVTLDGDSFNFDRSLGSLSVFLSLFRITLHIPEDVGLIAIAARQTQGKGQSSKQH